MELILKEFWWHFDVYLSDAAHYTIKYYIVVNYNSGIINISLRGQWFGRLTCHRDLLWYVIRWYAMVLIVGAIAFFQSMAFTFLPRPIISLHYLGISNKLSCFVCVLQMNDDQSVCHSKSSQYTQIQKSFFGSNYSMCDAYYAHSWQELWLEISLKKEIYIQDQAYLSSMTM